MRDVHRFYRNPLLKQLARAAEALAGKQAYYRCTPEGRAKLHRCAGQARAAAREAGSIALRAGNCVWQGTKRRVQDYATAGRQVWRGEYKAAGKTMVGRELRRLRSVGRLTLLAASTAGNGAAAAYGCWRGEENAARQQRFRRGLEGLLIAGVAIGVGAELWDSFETEAADLLPEVPVADLDGVEDGVFVGDTPFHLQELALQGELAGAHHVVDAVRDPEVRLEFLHEHGFDEAPAGWEVHHVVPLSEGGADSPDNMVLIREQDHDWITAQHRAFYGWQDGKEDGCFST